MSANARKSINLMNVAPWACMSGGVAALTAIPRPESRLLICAVLFALAAGSALRRLLFSPPAAAAEPGNYPFDARVPQPWERDRGPQGL